MVTAKISALYTDTKTALKSAGIENYRFEAAVLLEHFFDVKPHNIATLTEKNISSEAVNKLKEAVEKRIGGYPLQYIIGKWEFYGYPVYVGEGVLIPRQDTETLVEAVIEIAEKKPKIIDLCSGSGCIAIALDKEIKDSEVYAIEKSEPAFNFLNRNIILNNSKVKAVCGDIFDSSVINSFIEVDIIVSNPPYITDEDMTKLQKEVTFEPKTALEGGNDGLYFYRKITALWKDKIKQGGIIAYEIGIGQESDVSKILAENNFSDINYKKDLCGITRVIYGRKL